MQVAQYVVSGLTQALDNCSQASAAPYGVVTVGAITRTNVNKAAVMVSHLSSRRPQCAASTSQQVPAAWAFSSSAAAPARLLLPWSVALSKHRLGSPQPAPVPYSGLPQQDCALSKAVCACSPHTGGVCLPAAQNNKCLHRKCPAGALLRVALLRVVLPLSLCLPLFYWLKCLKAGLPCLLYRCLLRAWGACWRPSA